LAIYFLYGINHSKEEIGLVGNDGVLTKSVTYESMVSDAGP
jgi:hypothetical protein